MNKIAWKKQKQMKLFSKRHKQFALSFLPAFPQCGCRPNWIKNWINSALLSLMASKLLSKIKGHLNPFFYKTVLFNFINFWSFSDLRLFDLSCIFYCLKGLGLSESNQGISSEKQKKHQKFAKKKCNSIISAN